MALKPARLQWSDDGSLLSLDYGDIYFQRGLGLEESHYVFLQGNKLPERFPRLAGTFHVAEAGFGSGLNFLLTARLFDKTAPPDARLFYASFEKHPVLAEDLRKIYAHFAELSPFSGALLEQYPPLVEGFHTLQFGRVTLLLALGDIAALLPQLQGKFDAWYLDGFSPAKNPGMWAEDLYALIAARTKPGGTVATFSSAGHVRRGLSAAGFAVQKTQGFGVKRDMTVAAIPGEVPVEPPKHVAVLGAGIAGCSVAHALAKRGHRVTLIDRHANCAAETSGNPVGILYPKLTVDVSPMGMYHSHAFCFARNLVKSLQLPSWRECGVTHMDLTAEDRTRTQQLFQRNEFPAEYAAQTEDGLHQEFAGFLSPPEFCRTLVAHENIACDFNRSVKHLSDIEADAVVIALGQGSKSFAETAWLPLQSLRGQITMLKPTLASQNLDHVICHDGYITPVENGLHCIGATFQKEEYTSMETRAEDDTENLEKLNRYLPQFNFDSTRIAGSRSGYRATTPDKLPVAGPCPDYARFTENFAPLRAGQEAAAERVYHDRLYVSTGFGAHGMTGAPLAGAIIAAEISGDPCPVPQYLREHLMPERFILRDLKRKKI